MSKRKYCDRELNDLQKLKKENQRLKKQVSVLRKQLARINIDEFEHVKDLLEKQEEEDFNESLAEDNEKQKKLWECYKCHEGTMKLHIFERRDGIFYFRKCDTDTCSNRTTTKKYDETVKGIK